MELSTNSISTDEFTKLVDLVQYKKYRILKFVPFVRTDFGPRVEIHLDYESIAYLPARFNKLSIIDIIGLNQIKVAIMRTGTRPCNYGMMADFLFFNEMEGYLDPAFKRLQDLNLMNRPYLPVEWLNQNKIHRVVKLSVIENRNGFKSIAHLVDGNFIYLPNSYDNISLAKINLLNQDPNKDIYILPREGNRLALIDKSKHSESFECCYE